MPAKSENTLAHDITEYTWKDKEYYKLYQGELYKTRLCKKCICEIYGTTTTFKNMKNHQTTNKCKRYLENNNAESFKNKVERIEKISSTLSGGLKSNLSDMD